MGISAELKAYEEWLRANGQSLDTWAERQVRWVEICVCGHEKAMHGPSAGGDYGGPEWGKTVDGCAGPPPSRNAPKKRMEADGMVHVDPTCPCTVFRAVAEVDRPGRYYRQKTWTRDRVHPLIRGLQAQRTRLANSKKHHDAPDAELERRFRWLPGAQKCRVCKKTGDDVIPCYVNDERLSQMRCPDHYELPLAEAP